MLKHITDKYNVISCQLYLVSFEYHYQYKPKKYDLQT
jgi:hypothetical protein